MKHILPTIILTACLTLTGCYKFVAEQPGKTKADFYEDQALCEEEARAHMMELRFTQAGGRDDLSTSDEIDHTRQCMRALGWQYHFRKAE